MNNPLTNPTSGTSRPSYWQIAKGYSTFFFLLTYLTHPLENESLFRHLSSSGFAAIMGALFFTLLYRVAPKVAIGATILLLLWAGGDASAQSQRLTREKSPVQTVSRPKQRQQITTPTPAKPRQKKPTSAPLKTGMGSLTVCTYSDTCSNPVVTPFQPGKGVTALLPGGTMNPLKSMLTQATSQTLTFHALGTGVSVIQTGGIFGHILFRSRSAYGMVGIGYIRSAFWGRNSTTLQLGGGVSLTPRLSAGLQTNWVIEKQVDYPNGQSRVQTKPFLALALVGTVQISSRVALHIQYSPRSSTHNLSGFGLTYFL